MWKSMWHTFEAHVCVAQVYAAQVYVHTLVPELAGCFARQMRARFADRRRTANARIAMPLGLHVAIQIEFRFSGSQVSTCK